MPRVTWTLLFAIVPTILVTHVFSDKHKSSETVANLYETGIEAYLENRYPDCVEKLEQALQKYRSHNRNTQNCRLKCRHESEAAEPLFPVDIEDLRFHEKNVKNTLCLIKCKVSSNGDNGNISPELQKLFEQRKPYEYLHLCYYQVNDKQNAASAAFSYLVVHPNDQLMSNTLKKYSEFPEVNMKDVVNFEAKEYVYLYVYGADAYENKNWDAAINNMEESLISYLHAEDECRAQCEGPFDPGWYPDFVPTIANHFTYVLKCKRSCKEKLGSLNGELHEDLLASHYNYLQYAYFKKGNLGAACQSVASYLLFLPEDEAMLTNMRYYQTLPKVQDEFFTPSQEAIRYAQRDTYEQRILQYIKDEFKFNQTPKKDAEIKRLRRNFHITENATDLGGPERFSSDGLATSDDCKDLMYIANNFVSTNDGYTKGNVSVEGMSPHTKHEKFEGITITRITFLVYIGVLQPKHLELVLELTEEIRKQLIDIFQIEKQLYFTYTHLVCRSALPGGTGKRMDLSHKIHADNCNLMADNICEKIYPAYYWRDYSALLYLNDDFKGGEFIFSSDKIGQKIQRSITPKCGRMVAFSSGAENLHGVKAVTHGKRCALAVWFTLDPEYQEYDRDVSHHVLANKLNI